MKIIEEHYIIDKEKNDVYQRLLMTVIPTFGMRGHDEDGPYIFVDLASVTQSRMTSSPDGGTSATQSNLPQWYVTIRYQRPETDEDRECINNVPNEYNPNVSKLRSLLLGDCQATPSNESFYDMIKRKKENAPSENVKSTDVFDMPTSTTSTVTVASRKKVKSK